MDNYYILYYNMTDYDIYYDKYITYKMKYIILKNLMGGAPLEEIEGALYGIQKKNEEKHQLLLDLVQLDISIKENNDELKKHSADLLNFKKNIAKPKSHEVELKQKKVKLTGKIEQIKHLLPNEEELLKQLEQVVKENESKLIGFATAIDDASKQSGTTSNITSNIKGLIDKIIGNNTTIIPLDKIKKVINIPQLGLSLEDKNAIVEALLKYTEKKAHVDNLTSALKNSTTELTKLDEEIVSTESILKELEEQLHKTIEEINNLKIEAKNLLIDKNSINEKIKYIEKEVKTLQKYIDRNNDKKSSEPHPHPHPSHEPNYPGPGGNYQRGYSGYGSYNQRYAPGARPEIVAPRMGRSNRAKIRELTQQRHENAVSAVQEGVANAPTQANAAKQANAVKGGK